MPIQLSPYINFQGRAREAIEFYHKVVGGHLDLQSVDGQGRSRPAGSGDRITHARLETDGAIIVASDGHPDYPATVGNNMAIALSGSDRDRLTGIFDGPAEGGTVQMPLTPQHGNAQVGWLIDRFGLTWTVRIDEA